MVIDALDPREGPARTFVMGDDTLRVAALIVGAGWGGGVQAAAFTRDVLRRHWTKWLPDSADRVSSDVREFVAQVPPEFDPEGDDTAFSVVVLLCRPQAVSMVASGGYAVRFNSGTETQFLFKPRLLGDDLVREGKLSAAEVASFEHKDILTGPFLGHSDELFLAHRATRPGDQVIVSDFPDDASAPATTPTIVVAW